MCTYSSLYICTHMCMYMCIYTERSISKYIYVFSRYMELFRNRGPILTFKVYVPSPKKPTELRSIGVGGRIAYSLQLYSN